MRMMSRSARADLVGSRLGPFEQLAGELHGLGGDLFHRVGVTPIGGHVDLVAHRFEEPGHRGPGSVGIGREEAFNDLVGLAEPV